MWQALQGSQSTAGNTLGITWDALPLKLKALTGVRMEDSALRCPAEAREGLSCCCCSLAQSQGCGSTRNPIVRADVGGRGGVLGLLWGFGASSVYAS